MAPAPRPRRTTHRTRARTLLQEGTALLPASAVARPPRQASGATRHRLSPTRPVHRRPADPARRPTRVLGRSRRLRRSRFPVSLPRCPWSIRRGRRRLSRLPPAQITLSPRVGTPLRQPVGIRTCTLLTSSTVDTRVRLRRRRTRASGTTARRHHRSASGERRRCSTAGSTRGGELGAARACGRHLLGRMTHGPCLDGQGLLVVCPAAGFPYALWLVTRLVYMTSAFPSPVISCTNVATLLLFSAPCIAPHSTRSDILNSLLTMLHISSRSSPSP